jgi:Ca-activated chloride channel family protein
MPDAEMKERVAELGVKYQLVTDQTSMLVLDDQGFAENGVERLNQARTDTEHAAQSNGSGQGTPAPVSGNSTNGTTSGNATSSGTTSDAHDVYGGALDPLSIGLVALWLLGGRRRNGARE